MTSRRGDAVYFLILVGALGIALWLARGPGADDAPSAELPDFSMPGIELEIPFELPVAFLQFRRPESPRLELALGQDTERALAEVRHALLESSGRSPEDVAVERVDHLGLRPGAP